MYSSEDELTPIYADDLASRRFVGVLWRTALGAAVAVAALTGVALVVTHQLAEDRAWDHELVIAAMASEMSPGRAAPLIEASGRRAIVVDPAGRVEAFGPADVNVEGRQRRWLERVVVGAASAEGRQFTSTDPDGDAWWHTAIAIDDRNLLITSRPGASAMDPWREQAIVILGLAGLALLAVAAGSLAALRLVGRPARLLADAGDQLRVRGRISEGLRQDLGRIGRTPVELRQLVENFAEFEHDLQRSDRQVAALLTAGTSLGGSLDQATVLARTLEHLEHLLEVERSVIIRHERRVDRFEVVASRGHDDAYVADLASRADDPTLPSLRSLRERRPIQVPDTEAEVVSEGLRMRGRRHGYRSLLAIPLTEELEQPTVLLLHSRSPRTYSFDEVQLSRSFGAIAGAALRNAELFESTDARLRTQTSRLEAIVGSVDQGILVENDRGHVFFANPIMRSLLPAGTDVDGLPDANRFVESVVSQSPNPTTTANDLGQLEPDGSSVDVTLDVDGEASTYRVRRFTVRDTKGQVIGRGQTWRDVSRERELDRMKRGLLAAVSHEFRSPLGLIKGYATTLLADDVDWDATDRREFLQLVSAEADRLADLVKRILDMRRIDAGMVSLQRLPIAVEALIEQAIVALPTERSRITVGRVEPATIEVDPARLVTALRNLVDNACQYSPDDRPVEIEATIEPIDGAAYTSDPAADGEHPSQLRIAVRDHGAGVSPARRDEIFETFIRGDSGLDAPRGGLGLGLAIAKGFVEAHGGRIHIDDPTDGGPGAVFSIRLPLADRAPTESALEAAR